MITIIDSGGSNISSIQFAFQRLGVECQLSHDAEIIRQSSHLILPGVSSANYAMNKLREYSLIHLIRELTQPVLGICLGMQIFFDFSEEGNVDCLGIIPGKVRKLSADNVIVPHMGWNTINIIKPDPLMKNIDTHSHVYFVHSYAAPVCNETTSITSHGSDFSASTRYKNFYGTQFHPEKSGRIGARILRNFLDITE